MEPLTRDAGLRSIVAAVAISALAVGTACQTPTPPTGPTPASGTPIIRSVEPSVPQPSPTPQTIRIVGLDFRAGATVTATLPDGGTLEVTGAAVQVQVPTTIDVSLTLATPGTYRLSVRNANGFRSDPHEVSVVNEQDRRPAVDALLPASAQRSTQPRTISVLGRNFLAGVTIRLTDPLGAIRTLDDSSLVRRSDTALDVTAIFDRLGVYTLVVVNPTGETSETMTLTVN